MRTLLSLLLAGCGESATISDRGTDAFVAQDAADAGVDASLPQCLHDVCIEGAALDPACSPCAARVGELEEYCKYIRWEEFCVGVALENPDVCTCAPERDCADLVDQDRDGLFDCDDPDCRAASCATGATKIGDPCEQSSDCAADGGDPICLDPTRWEWPNGFCTELCNLSPDDCAGAAVCQDIGLPGGRGVCQIACDPETTECRDGYECRLELGAGPFCVPVIETCDNGVDDDFDGDTDCAEWDCLWDPACPEICDDGTDDNGDGDTDCEDLRCVDFPGCLAHVTPACEGLPPERASCVSVGAPGFPCDPVTSEGCLPGQTCDLVGGTFLCFGAPNDVPYCERCGGLRGRCSPGSTCMNIGPVRCAPYCCTDADCGPSATCNHSFVATVLSRASSPVGVCVTR